VTGDASEGGGAPRPLRIAFLLHSFPEWSETFLLRQVTGLLDRGHDVALFCREEGAGDVVHEAVGRYRLLDRIRYVEVRRDAPPVRPRPRRDTIAALAQNPWLLRRLFRLGHGGFPDGAALRFGAALARTGPFDIVHAHYGDVALQLGVAAELVSAPLVASFYGYDCSSYPRRHGETVFVPLFARAAVVTALSGIMADRLRALGCPADKIRLHRIGVDTSAFSRSGLARTGTPRVLTVARLVEKKGVDTVIRALALLRPEFPALRLDVVGDGPLRSELERLAGAAGVAEAVRFHGAQTGIRVAEFMRDADCFVLSSVTGADGDEEGTPTVLMEASSMTLPVVSTWHSGIPEVVLDGETGLLAPPGDVEALADRIRRLLRDPELRRRLGDRGRAHIAEHFDMPVLTRRLEAIYREIKAQA
jgi:colanic acid/amylovoran biosynthesis glycosyltransferase